MRLLSRHNRQSSCAALDIGTSKMSCLITETVRGEAIKVVGFGHRRSEGIRNGLIVDIREAAECIRSTVHAAEDMAERRINTLAINLTVGDPNCAIRHAAVDVSAHEISDHDIERLRAETALQSRRAGESILHSVTLRFAIDGSAAIRDPRGMYGQTLSTEILHVTVKSGALKSLIRCVNLCDLDVESVTISSYAAAWACCEQDERRLGVACIDLGGGTTGLAVMVEDRLVHVDTLPIGGTHITHDIARGLGVGLATAERLKTVHGSILPDTGGGQDTIDVPLLGGESQQISHALLNGIIRPRMEEILELVRDRIETSGYNTIIGDRVVLSGGGALLHGTKEMAEVILNRRVRVGIPHGLAALPETATGPAFATNIGLAVLGLNAIHRPATKLGSRGGLLNRMGLWLRESF